MAIFLEPKWHRKITHELIINDNTRDTENSRYAENRQNVQNNSGNVRRDNDSDSLKVKEIDGNTYLFFFGSIRLSSNH